jgi:hypothetical protein
MKHKKDKFLIDNENRNNATMSLSDMFLAFEEDYKNGLYTKQQRQEDKIVYSTKIKNQYCCNLNKFFVETVLDYTTGNVVNTYRCIECGKLKVKLKIVDDKTLQLPLFIYTKTLVIIGLLLNSE